MASCPIISSEIHGETVETVFLVAPKSLQMVTAAMLAPWKKSNDQPRWHIKKQRHYYASKGTSNPDYGFPVVMYGWEIWTVKKAEW